MSDKDLFYIFGIALAISAVLLTFAGLKLKNFPGRAFPVVILWFVALVIGSATFAVRESQHEAHAREAEHHETAEKIEEGSSGPYENEGGALGGESEELEEEAEEETEDAVGEEPVGGVEGSEETGGGDPDAGATVFAEHCAGCHGETGKGGPAGPDLTTMPLAQTEAGTVQQVTNGGGGMPAFGGQLSEEEISNVAAFVVQNVVGK